MQSKTLLALLATAMLSACGGDDTGTTTPPTFGTAQLEYSYVEGGTGPVGTVQISGSAPSGGIGLNLSGADANLFAISSAGVLTFRTSPDFEAPADAGANNVYNFTITAIDTEGSTASVAVVVTVTNDGAAATALYVDTVFAETTTLATLDVASDSGTLTVTLIEGVGDTQSDRPLVLLAPGSDADLANAIATGFAQRGYVVGLIGIDNASLASSSEALGSAIALFSDASFNAAALGIDANTILLAGEGVGARAVSQFAMGNTGLGNVVGAFSYGGGLYSVERAGNDSASLFAAGLAQQGNALLNAYQGSGAVMQFLPLSSGAEAANIEGVLALAAPFLFSNAVQKAN